MNELTLSYRLNIYASQHAFHIESQEFQHDKFGEAKPLTLKGYKKILSLAKDDVFQERTYNELIDPSIISFNERIEGNHVMWWDPPQKHKISVSGRKTPYNVNLPALLYFYNGDTLELYAMKIKDRPKLDTDLFYAPVKNQIDGFKFCWGSVWKDDRDIRTPNSAVKHWKRALWGSNFNSDGPDRLKTKGTYQLYKELHDKATKFPLKELIPAKKTIRDLLRT